LDVTATNQKQARVIFGTYPSYRSAAQAAKAFAMRYGETVDVKAVDGGVAVLVSPNALKRWELENGSSRRPAASATIPENTAEGRALVARLTRPEAKAGVADVAGPWDRSDQEPRCGAVDRKDEDAPTSQDAAYHECSSQSEAHPTVNQSVVVHVDSRGNALIGAAFLESADSATTYRLVSDLRHAYAAAPPREMADWAKASFVRFGTSLTRRVGNVGRLATQIARVLGREMTGLANALGRGQTLDHIRARATRAGQSSAEYVGVAWEQASALIEGFKSDPGKVGPDLLVAALAFYCAGGGIDGDGGIPDKDIALFGIGGHRSIFTHSILAGAVVEASLFSLYDLLRRAYEYLPSSHHPVWDRIHNGARRATSAAVKGSGVGIAYHVGIDATLQPAAYHDLPFAASLEVHQAIMGGNAGVEGLDVFRKPPLGPASKGQTPESKGVLSEIAVGLAGVVALVLFELS
jgi:hypothetical protein